MKYYYTATDNYGNIYEINTRMHKVVITNFGSTFAEVYDVTSLDIMNDKFVSLEFSRGFEIPRLVTLTVVDDEDDTANTTPLDKSIDKLQMILNDLLNKYESLCKTGRWETYDTVSELSNILDAITDLQYSIGLLQSMKGE